MAKFFDDFDRRQSKNEEIANSISHGIGLIAALIGMPFLVIHAGRYENPDFVSGTYLFAASVIILYLASTLYHGFPSGKIKAVLRVIEHSAIYILIAGTYSPFTLGVLRDLWGGALLWIVWALALSGVALKAFAKLSHPILSTALYLIMGWIIIVAVIPLLERMPTSGFLWLLGGGLFYSAGVAFYATDAKLKYGHFIWHLFVLSGTVCHYFAVLWYGA